MHLILLVFALACFVLAAWTGGAPAPTSNRLIAAGLAFLTAAMIPWPL